jgi:hypothetical protein
MAQRYATVSDVVALFPALSGADAVALGTWLDATSPMIGLAVYGPLASQAHACLAAHNAAVAGVFDDVPGAATESGQVMGESNGPASRQYASSALYSLGADAIWTGSPYGRKYVEFRRMALARVGGSAVISNGRAR